MEPESSSQSRDSSKAAAGSADTIAEKEEETSVPALLRGSAIGCMLEHQDNGSFCSEAPLSDTWTCIVAQSTAPLTYDDLVSASLPPTHLLPFRWKTMIAMGATAEHPFERVTRDRSPSSVLAFALTGTSNHSHRMFSAQGGAWVAHRPRVQVTSYEYQNKTWHIDSDVWRTMFSETPRHIAWLNWRAIAPATRLLLGRAKLVEWTCTDIAGRRLSDSFFIGTNTRAFTAGFACNPLHSITTSNEAHVCLWWMLLPEQRFGATVFPESFHAAIHAQMASTPTGVALQPDMLSQAGVDAVYDLLSELLFNTHRDLPFCNSAFFVQSVHLLLFACTLLGPPTPSRAHTRCAFDPRFIARKWRDPDAEDDEDEDDLGNDSDEDACSDDEDEENPCSCCRTASYGLNEEGQGILLESDGRLGHYALYINRSVSNGTHPADNRLVGSTHARVRAVDNYWRKALLDTACHGKSGGKCEGKCVGVTATHMLASAFQLIHHDRRKWESWWATRVSLWPTSAIEARRHKSGMVPLLPALYSYSLPRAASVFILAKGPHALGADIEYTRRTIFTNTAVVTSVFEQVIQNSMSATVRSHIFKAWLPFMAKIFAPVPASDTGSDGAGTAAAAAAAAAAATTTEAATNKRKTPDDGETTVAVPPPAGKVARTSAASSTPASASAVTVAASDVSK